MHDQLAALIRTPEFQKAAEDAGLRNVRVALPAGEPERAYVLGDFPDGFHFDLEIHVPTTLNNPAPSAAIVEMIVMLFDKSRDDREKADDNN